MKIQVEERGELIEILTVKKAMKKYEIPEVQMRQLLNSIIDAIFDAGYIEYRRYKNE